jgi:periplasmic divalent cation tolerance protein
MPPDHDVVLIISSAPDLLVAKRIAHILIEEKLAACVNLGAPVLSIYEWNGIVEGADEIPMWIKTHVSQQQPVMQRLAELHPYEVPEIIVVPVVGGSEPYLAWVHEQSRGKFSIGEGHARE